MRMRINLILNFFSPLATCCLLLAATCSLLLFFPSPARAATIMKPPMSLGLAGYWSFNEGAGNQANDYSGNKNPTAFSTTTPPTWIDGKKGKAVNLSGNSYLSSPNSAALNISGGNITLSGWFKANTLSGKTILLTKGSYGLYWNYGFGFSGNNLLVRYTNGDIISTSTTVSLGQWHYFSAVYSGTSTIFYLDGKLTDTLFNNNWSAATGIQQLTVGGSYTSSSQTYSEKFNGSIDDLRIYNRALSATEIQTLYNAGSAKIITPNKLGLVGYWSMDEGSGNIAHDFSGNSLNGTLSGNPSPTWISGKHIGATSFGGTPNCGSSCSNYGLISTNNISLPSTLSVCTWIYPKYSAVSELIIHGPGPTHYAFEFYQSGLAIVMRGGSSTAAVSASLLMLNKWNFVCGTINSTIGIIYINGIASAPATIAAPSTTSAAINIGAYSNNNYAFNGYMDDVRIYNRTLSAAEVLGLYQSSEVKINSPQNNKLTTGLIGLWTFNGPDVSGSIMYDRSGQGNDGTSTGTTKLAIGKIGQAFNFDGNSYINLGNKNIFNFTDFTASAWIKPQSGAVGILGKWGTTPYYYIEMSGNDICVRLSNSTFNTYCAGSSVIPYNQWSHVAATVNSSSLQLKIYVNSVLKGPYSLDPGQIGPYTNSNSFNIGNIGNALGSYNFKGSIDEVRLYNRALTAAEINQLYLMGK